MQNTPQRKIIHIDMDCFYAAIEMRDDPRLRKRPLAVGGAADKRGVLCTCNYVARQYGLHAAMASAHALRLCPDLVIIPPRMQRYREVAHAIAKNLREITTCIEPLSLDEAYLDVTASTHCQGSAIRMARYLRERIYAEHGLTASAGIAANKFLAKVASDWRKPNGQFAITPLAVDAFMQTLPVSKIAGVGKVTAQRMHKLHIHTCGDLQKLSLLEITQLFGNSGNRLYELARGIDNRAVNTSRERKSLSVEHTFERDLTTLAACVSQLEPLYQQLQRRLAQHAPTTAIHKQFVKIKFHDFQHTRIENTTQQLSPSLFTQLLTTGYARQQKPIRLLGIGVGFANTHSAAQLALI